MTPTDLVREAITTRRQGSNLANDVQKMVEHVVWGRRHNIIASEVLAVGMLSEDLRSLFRNPVPGSARIGEFWQKPIEHGLSEVRWTQLAKELYDAAQPSPESPAQPHAAELAEVPGV